jgi:hypothetical protein
VEGKGRRGVAGGSGKNESLEVEKNEMEEKSAVIG